MSLVWDSDRLLAAGEPEVASCRQLAFILPSRCIPQDTEEGRWKPNQEVRFARAYHWATDMWWKRNLALTHQDLINNS